MDTNNEVMPVEAQAVPAKRVSLADIAASQGAARAGQPAATPVAPAEPPAVVLSPAVQQRARELAATIDFTKSGIESTYARDAQQSM